MLYGINAGSGQRKFQSIINKVEWVNLDINPKWEPDVVGDWNKLAVGKDAHYTLTDENVRGTEIFIRPNFYDYIVAHHTIEHVGCGEAQPFFKGAYETLKPGGSLIITIPDIKALAKRFLLGQIDEYTYLVNMMGAYMDSENDRHKWHYTYESLSKELIQVGVWERIRPFNFRPIPGADIAQDWWILGVEAIK